MDYEQFKLPVYELTNIDLNFYKERQMKRRIDALIKKKNFNGYEDFVEGLSKDKKLLEEFVGYMTINVSQFYRNSEQWEILEQEIIPGILKKNNGHINVWSAACSTGDEPYSMAMLLSKLTDISKVRIFATDIDDEILSRAREGIYPDKSLADLPKQFIDKYFDKLGNGKYKITDSIKQCVEFKHHDLLRDPYPSGFDLILCRNVVIYFTDEAKNYIYTNFNRSLKEDGILFVGCTEQIINYRELNFSSVKTFFYKKK